MPNQPPPTPVQMPDTLSASALQINATPVSFLMALGNSRLMLSPEPWNGHPPSQVIDWQWVFQIAPQFAVQLRDALSGVIEGYESAFGPIPKAPEPHDTGGRVVAFTPRLVDAGEPSRPPASPRTDRPVGLGASIGQLARSQLAPTGSPPSANAEELDRAYLPQLAPPSQDRPEPPGAA